MTSLEIPATGSAEVHVLHNGYVGLDGDGERVSGTVTIKAHGPAPQGVTDVVFSHHHPDHTVNAALSRPGIPA